MIHNADESARNDLAADRREFIRHLAALFAAAGAALGARGTAHADQSTAAVTKAPVGNLVGVQMGPHTMLDEGIDACLDLIQDTAVDRHGLRLQPRVRRRSAQGAQCASPPTTGNRRATSARASCRSCG